MTEFRSRNDLINRAGAKIDDVDLPVGVFAERCWALQIESTRPGWEERRCDILKIRGGRSVVIQGEDFVRQKIAEDVPALERGNLRAAIDVSANNRAADGAIVVENWIHVPGRRGTAYRRITARSGDFPFAQTPAVVFTAPGVGRLLHIDLFPRILADITDVHPPV